MMIYLSMFYTGFPESNLKQMLIYSYFTGSTSLEIMVRDKRSEGEKKYGQYENKLLMD